METNGIYHFRNYSKLIYLLNCCLAHLGQFHGVDRCRVHVARLPAGPAPGEGLLHGHAQDRVFGRGLEGHTEKGRQRGSG